MTIGNFSTMNADRQRLLLETAAREFAGAGFERASLNRIIKTCGMSKSSFYHYFSSKEALFDTVVQRAASSLGDALHVPSPRKLAGPDFWEKIGELAQQLPTLTDSQSWYVDFGKLFYLEDTPEQPGRELQAVMAQIAHWLEEVLAVGRASGAVREDLPPSLQIEMTFALVRAMDRWTLRHLDEMGPDSMQDLAASQIDLLRRLLAP